MPGSGPRLRAVGRCGAGSDLRREGASAHAASKSRLARTAGTKVDRVARSVIVGFDAEPRKVRFLWSLVSTGLREATFIPASAFDRDGRYAGACRNGRRWSRGRAHDVHVRQVPPRAVRDRRRGLQRLVRRVARPCRARARAPGARASWDQAAGRPLREPRVWPPAGHGPRHGVGGRSVELTQLWLGTALGLYVLAVLLGLFVYTPTLRSQIRVLDAEGAASPAFQALSKRGTVVGMVLAVASSSRCDRRARASASSPSGTR